MKIDLTEEQLRQEITVDVPLGWLLERGIGAPAHVVNLLSETGVRYARNTLPPIGEPFSTDKLEEIYAGITLHDNEAFALVLLPDDVEGNWQHASSWAETVGGVLPSRFDLLVLWQNLKGHFKKEAYWSSEQHAGGAASAWFQSFSYGYQDWRHKDSELRARAVRRVPL